MDVDYGYGNGTKVRLDNDREGTIIGRTGIVRYTMIRKEVKSIDHFYIVEFKNGHGDYLRNEEGKFKECFVSTLLVHVSNIMPTEVLD